VAFVQYDGNAVSRPATTLLCGETPYPNEYPSSEYAALFLVSALPDICTLLHARMASMQRTVGEADNGLAGLADSLNTSFPWVLPLSPSSSSPSCLFAPAT